MPLPIIRIFLSYCLPITLLVGALHVKARGLLKCDCRDDNRTTGSPTDRHGHGVDMGKKPSNITMFLGTGSIVRVFRSMAMVPIHCVSTGSDGDAMRRSSSKMGRLGMVTDYKEDTVPHLKVTGAGEKCRNAGLSHK